MLLLLASVSCGQSKAPVGPGPRDDAAASIECDALVEKTKSLYQAAATQEKLALNLQAEFVEANTHMVMVDCKAAPKTVGPCIAEAASVKQIEEECLAPLDEAGSVEGQQFSNE